MENSLISVIVPVYNTEKYLTECVESIISQTYRNLEIILVDDGSTDLSGSICDGFAEKDSRIKVIHQENAGVSAARNHGLDECHGEYVAFVDSDDYIDRCFFSVLSGKIIETGSECAASGYLITDEHRNIKSEHNVRHQTIMSGEEALISRYKDYSQDLNLVYVNGKLYRKMLFSDIRFTENLYYEDSMIMPYWCLKCRSIVFSTYSGYFYRRNENSITANTNPDHLKKLYNDSFIIFNDHIALYNRIGNKKLCDCIENELADKIITHSIKDNIPSGLKKQTKAEFNRHYKAIIHSEISIRRKLKILFFRIAGINCTRMLYRLKNR